MGRPTSIFDVIHLIGVDVIKTTFDNLNEVDESIYYWEQFIDDTG